jgi:predicted patatin/cPLA2 family phospholipase
MAHALVVEGGAMRGIFTGGVLDAFLYTGYDPFDLYLGVSSGTLMLGSFVAQQYQRNYRVFTQIATQPEFIDVARFLRGGHMMDLDWLWRQHAREPLDVDTAVAHLQRHQRTLHMVTTDVETGQPTYLRPTADDWLDCAKASAAIPFFYRGFVRVHGRDYTDGGISDPLPILKAYQLGARQFTVIRTRPTDCYEEPDWGFSIASKILWRYPHLQTTFRLQYEVYMDALTFLNAPPAGVTVRQIAPLAYLHSGRTSRNIADLHHDYTLGYTLGLSLAMSAEC